MSAYKTEQEDFWAGEFGDDYLKRNGLTPSSLASRLALWSKIVRNCPRRPSSILELGANIGINLHAFAMLLPGASLTGLEINSSAANVLRQWGGAEVIETSLFDFSHQKKWDFVFTSGVLIHLSPDLLPDAYVTMATCSSRYVCMVEYYNPSPVTVTYRNNTEKLFKRDFAGEFLAANTEFELRDYGFVYHKDPIFPGDDLTWFLLERQ